MPNLITSNPVFILCWFSSAGTNTFVGQAHLAVTFVC